MRNVPSGQLPPFPPGPLVVGQVTLLIIIGVIVLAALTGALVWWRMVDKAAQHEYEQSERAWRRSGGGQITVIRESGRHRG